MPKRSQSFEEHLLPQLKVHVSDKEVNNEEKMKSVYEKTKELLFKGANTKAKGANAKANDDLPLTTVAPKTAHNDQLRQTCLNKSCQIETHGAKLNPVFEECKSCHDTKMVSCQYCDGNLCFNCSVVCDSCQQMYCESCIISEYVGDGVKVTCNYCGD